MSYSIHYTTNGKRVVNSTLGTLAAFLSSVEFDEINVQISDFVFLSTSLGYELLQAPTNQADSYQQLDSGIVASTFTSFGQFKGELVEGTAYLLKEIVQYTDNDGYVSIAMVNVPSYTATNYADDVSNGFLKELINASIFNTPVTAAQAARDAAQTSASQCNADRVAADGSKDAAAASEAKALQWAEEPEDSTVETSPDKYSALHWAAKAAASYAAYVADAADDFATIVANLRAELTTTPIVTTEIGDDQVTAAKLADLCIDAAAKLADNIIPTSKLSETNVPIQLVNAEKTDDQTISGSTSTWTDITNLSATITRRRTNGKIRVQAVVQVANNNDKRPVFLRVLRDTTPVGIGNVSGNRERASAMVGHAVGGHGAFSGVIDFIDDRSADPTASFTYKVQARPSNGTTGYINRTRFSTDIQDYGGLTLSSITLTELT